MQVTIVMLVTAAAAGLVGLRRRARGALVLRLAGERGEGVISTAIAVLIMALVGLAMWQLFDRVFTDAGTEIEENVNDIGG
jgi:hypothetical protein